MTQQVGARGQPLALPGIFGVGRMGALIREAARILGYGHYIRSDRFAFFGGAAQSGGSDILVLWGRRLL